MWTKLIRMQIWTLRKDRDEENDICEQWRKQRQKKKILLQSIRIRIRIWKTMKWDLTISTNRKTLIRSNKIRIRLKRKIWSQTSNFFKILLTMFRVRFLTIKSRRTINWMRSNNQKTCLIFIRERKQKPSCQDRATNSRIFANYVAMIILFKSFYTSCHYNFEKNENKKTSFWISEHISRIQRHCASARDAVSKSETLHIYARCSRDRLIVLQHTKLRNLLSLSNVFDFCKYDSNRTIFNVDYQIWNESFWIFFKSWNFNVLRQTNIKN
jgi:hypothetical protein